MVSQNLKGFYAQRVKFFKNWKDLFPTAKYVLEENVEKHKNLTVSAVNISCFPRSSCFCLQLFLECPTTLLLQVTSTMIFDKSVLKILILEMSFHTSGQCKAWLLLKRTKCCCSKYSWVFSLAQVIAKMLNLFQWIYCFHVGCVFYVSWPNGSWCRTKLLWLSKMQGDLPWHRG